MQDQPLAFPESEPFEVPVNWNTSKRHQDRVVVAGRGPKPADIMFLASGTLEEEVVEEEHGMHGAIFRRKPAFLKGPHGVELKDMCMSVGISVDSEVYYTALCKWLLGRDRNLNPKAGDIQPGLACCRREIKEVAPKIIVAFGKAAFEFLVPIRFKFGDAIGMWFWSEEFQCRVMPMSSQYYVAAKPEWMERYRMDMAQVKKLSDELKGIAVERVPLHYRTVTCAAELRQLVQDIMPFTLYCPDCEWHGKNHAAGKLRSLQIGWQPGHAAYIRFMDDKLNYVFDVSYEEAGAILAPAWNRPEVKLIGHHISADLPWIAEWLKLEWYGKVRLDTEFAYQCCNEHGERGLERMSLRYTDLGRYEFELEMWKKDHKQEVEDGYGWVPDNVLIPYACLRQESLVCLADGSWRKIKDLVEQKFKGKVLAFVAGQVKACRVTNWFKHNAKQKQWVRLKTASVQRGKHGVLGPVFTPDHKIITQRGKVAVEDLVIGVDRIQTRYKMFNVEQLSILLACLLGDGGIAKRNDAFSGVLMSQCTERSAYLKWKVSALFGHEEVQRVVARKNQVYYCSEYSPYISELAKMFPRHSRSEHVRRKLIFTHAVADKMGLLGLAVWYQDDGNLTDDGECRITCQKFSDQEIETAEAWFKSLGVPAKYRHDQGHFAWDVKTSKRLLSMLSPFIHPDCAYKAHGACNIYNVVTECDLFCDLITDVIDASHPRRKGNGYRYCLEVAEAGNFLTKVGFVSNCRDVDVPLRALPYIELDLQQQGMLEYYRTIMNPFVSDVFTQFAITGLPMNVPLMDEMRLLYSYAYSEMEAALRRSLYTEAWFLLARNAVEILPAFKAVDEPLRGIVSKQAVANFKLELQDAYERHGAEEMQIPSTKVIRDLCMAFLQLEEGSLTPEDLRCLDASCNHACSTHAFNLRSVTDMRRWLFDIKKYTPVKSTANKAKGVPSMDWAKVMSWKPSRREGIVPAVDKQTLQILSVAHDDPVLKELLELNAVGNIRKAFLKDPELDEDGNVVEEAGLHAWLAPDHRVHGQMSMTETARPRAWKPNSLNWPSYVQQRIVDGIARVLKIAHERGDLPQVFEKYLKDKPPALRHCVQAPPGMCFVESDFKTAEVRALAYRAGDENLIRIMNEPDQQFGLAPVKTKDGAIKYKPVRLKYDADCGILPHEQDSRFIMNVWSEGKFECKVAPEDLKRDKAGNLIHPPADLHWSLAEMFQEKPRELMTDKKDRGAGKAGNFKCLPEDTVVTTSHGAKTIKNVVAGLHKVWDGVDWVHHEGLITKGIQPIVEYQGLRATVDHGVWVEDGGEMFFGEAILQGLNLARTTDETGEAAVAGFEANHIRRIDRGSNTEEVPYHGRPKEILIAELSARGFKLTLEHVYDLVNAGPRRRFTANGVLVSNTAYGSTPGTLERSIEADTGFKPEPGTGQKILDALQRRQPTAVAFLDDLETKVEDPGYLRAASGKVRHFLLPSNVHGLSPRLKNAIISAQKRESRNFYMQESVAATALRATYWLLQFKRKYGLVGVPITVLYDSVVTMCPFEERAIWAKAHELFMFRANGWEYHGRVLTYPIDTEFNAGWSMPYKATIDQKHIGPLLENENFCPTPERLRPVETWLDDSIAFYTANTRASLEPKHFV